MMIYSEEFKGYVYLNGKMLMLDRHGNGEETSVVLDFTKTETKKEGKNV